MKSGGIAGVSSKGGAWWWIACLSLCFCFGKSKLELIMSMGRAFASLRNTPPSLPPTCIYEGNLHLWRGTCIYEGNLYLWRELVFMKGNLYLWRATCIYEGNLYSWRELVFMKGCCCYCCCCCCCCCSCCCCSCCSCCCCCSCSGRAAQPGKCRRDWPEADK